ncbi:MAG: biotin--[Clostridia bacterium]|nr:biotin--[acetyl-CoA-carboxylase] ligase [Clostridia bacterium]
MINFPLREVYLESVDSTNSYLKRIVKESEPACGLSVMAESQTSGRGRLGRSWLSAEGNTLCMSICVKNKYCEGFTLLVALAVFEALKPFCKNKELQIKWPNDIIMENKKLCGILCERVSEYTVIGIGININNEDFPMEIKNKATSLYLLNGEKYELKAVFRAVNAAVENILTRYNFIFTEEAKKAYAELCANLGRNVTTESKSGVAVDIDANGSLILNCDGETVSITSGEVAIHGIY